MKKAAKRVLINGLSERQFKEMQADQMKLKELEKKLEEVRERKKLKEMRAQQRMENKIRFNSCIKIQTFIKKFLCNRRVSSSNIIIDFLRVSTYKQAITAAAWAIDILRNFVYTVSIKWKNYKAKEQAISLLTYKLLDDVNNFVTAFSEKKMEEINALAKMSSQLKSPKNFKRNTILLSKTKNKFGSFSPNRQSKSACFITESKSNSSSPLDSLNSPKPNSISQMDESNKLIRSSSSFVAQANIPKFDDSFIPNLNNENKIPSANKPNKNNSNNNQMVSSITSVEIAQNFLIAKKFSEDEEEKIRILEQVHLKRQEEIEKERLRRLRSLQQSRLKSEEKAREKKRAEDAESALKEIKRQEFLKRLAEEQLQNAKNIAKLRKEKEEQKLKLDKLFEMEKQKQRQENLLMTIEDKLSKDMDLKRSEREKMKLARKKESINKAKEPGPGSSIAPPPPPLKRPAVPRYHAIPDRDKSAKERIKLYEAAKKKFDEFDVDKNGYLERKEIDILMSQALEVYGESKKSSIEKENFKMNLVAKIDVNKDGKIDFLEFKTLWEEMRLYTHNQKLENKKIKNTNSLIVETDQEKSNKHNSIEKSPEEEEEQIEKEKEKEKDEEDLKYLEEKARIKQIIFQKRLAERISKEKAEKLAQKAVEDTKKSNLDKVIYIDIYRYI